ncbi:MAG: KH domain-containing protein [Victivallaceae bacterium]|nr:KH domain-containing protein [Victivallaceae bacterium]
MTETTGNLEEQKAKTVKTLATMFDYLGLQADLKVSEKGPKIAITISSEEAGRIIGRKGQMLESFQIILNRMMYNNDSTFPRVVLDIDGYPRSRGSYDSKVPQRDSSDSNYEQCDDQNSRNDHYEQRDNRNRKSSYNRDDRDNGSNSYARDDRNSREDKGDTDEDTLKKQALDAAKEVKRWGDPTTLPRMNAHERRIIHITLEDDSEIITASDGDGNLKNVVISLKK